jgi:hypothetical protein
VVNLIIAPFEFPHFKSYAILNYRCAGFILYEMCTLENQRLILQKTDFNPAWKAKDLPVEYRDINKTFRA